MAVVIPLLQFMQQVMPPLVLAALLFDALDPAVDSMQKWRVPHALGATMMLFVAVGACGVLVYSLQGQV